MCFVFMEIARFSIREIVTAIRQKSNAEMIRETNKGVSYAVYKTWTNRQRELDRLVSK